MPNNFDCLRAFGRRSMEISKEKTFDDHSKDKAVAFDHKKFISYLNIRKYYSFDRSLTFSKIYS